MPRQRRWVHAGRYNANFDIGEAITMPDPLTMATYAWNYTDAHMLTGCRGKCARIDIYPDCMQMQVWYGP